jgi:hypothetical protein
MRQQGLSSQAVADTLQSEGFSPLRGRRLWPSAVFKLVNDPSLAKLASGIA